MRVYWLKTLKKLSIYPLGNTPSAPSVIRQVVLPIAGMHVEASVFTRDSVPHAAFKDTVVDKGHSEC